MRYAQARRSTGVVAGAAVVAALALGLSTAQRADSVATLVANRAYSTYHDSDIDLSNSFPNVPFARLSVPVAGNYVITAKLDVWNADVYATSRAQCKLSAGGDFDTLWFNVGDAETSVVERTETLVLHVTHTFTSSGTVTLQCTDYGRGELKAQFTKITAMQVAELTNTHF